MRVYLTNEALEFDIKTYLHAYFQNDTIEIVKDKQLNCDFEFQFIENRAGLMYYENQEIKYENWMGREHPLIVERNTSADPLKVDKKIAKTLIYKVAGNVVGRNLPWGVLTGVRPTKLVYQLIAEHGKKRQLIAEILHNDYKIAKDKVSLLLDIVGFDGEVIENLDPEGLSLYVGVPFCPSKCAYCSFASYSVDQFKDQIKDYLYALKMEMEYVSKHMVESRPITSFYIGGGTPTALSGLEFEQLLKMATTIFDLSEVQEFTVEAGRPDTIDEFKLKLMKGYGVNRISINPQTMNQETLDLIGRNHTLKDLEEKYLMAKDLGFDAINMDLIIGLPSESRVDVLYTLEQLWKFRPDNITVHTLAVKNGSKLKEHMNNYADYHMASALEIEEMLKMSRIQLELMGLKPYYMYRQKNTMGNFENIGYATEGKHSIYNIIMIEEVQTVIGMGSSAISKILHMKDQQVHIERIENVKQITDYINRIDEMIHRKKKAQKLMKK